MKIKQLFAAVVLLAATTAATAQDYPKNVVKLGLEGLTSAAVGVFPQVNLHYERMITARQGANIMLGIGIPSVISATDIATINKRAQDTATAGNSSQILLKSGSLSSFEIVGEYRFYVSEQEGPRGFYVAPQIYYKNFNGTLKGSHTKGTTNPTTASDEIQLNVNMLDVGVQLGAQWLIADKVSIDWMFLGLGAGFNTVSLSGKTDDSDRVEQWAADANKTIATDATIKAFGLTSATVLSNKAAGTMSVTAPIFPMYFRTALSVGYAF